VLIGAVGASALTSIEAMVNKKLEELERKRNTTPRFANKPFYKARSKIVHEGKEPTPEELEIIFKYLTLCSNSLKKI